MSTPRKITDYLRETTEGGGSTRRTRERSHRPPLRPEGPEQQSEGQ